MQILRLHLKTVKDVADVISDEKLFQTRAVATAKVRSLTDCRRSDD